MDSEEKMVNYARKVLSEEKGLKPGQQLRITATSEYLPFVKAMMETAYKDFKSGLVSVKLVEPELEALKRRYNITEDFEYKKLALRELNQLGAAFVTFDCANSPYEKAGLTKDETETMKNRIVADIPRQTREKLEINPEEILKVNLGIIEGQPVAITGHREHMSQIMKLVEYAYQHGSKLVNVMILESKENELDIPFYKYASDSVLETVPEAAVQRMREYLDKNVARLLFEGSDPTLYEGLNPERIARSDAAFGKAIKEFRTQLLFRNPWNIYYLPTTFSAAAAYPEYADKFEALYHAAVDTRKINRTGHLKEHIKNLKKVQDTMNKLIEQGYDTIHFVSIDPVMGVQDGKTDLKISLSEKSLFKAAEEKTPSGQTFVANTPTEEIFTSPDRTKTNGVVSATMPLILNGMMVEGIRIEFKDGKIAKDEKGELKVFATTNEKMLREHIKKHENADMLGELALVAGSPIFDMKRLFKSTLLDENAACHIAIGDGFPFCIEGATEIKDQKEQKAYLEKYNCNDSTTHDDFMIGGPYVQVYAEKRDGFDKVIVIKDNKFQIVEQ